jgi:hypothetical protein
VEGRGLSGRRTPEARKERELGDKPENSRMVSGVADSVTCDGYGDGVNLLREPDAANPHVRFDERVWKRQHGGASEAPTDAVQHFEVMLIMWFCCRRRTKSTARLTSFIELIGS